MHHAKDSKTHTVPFKVRKVPTNDFPCEVIIENFLNHLVNSLEVTIFKELSKQVCEKVKNMFTLGMVPSRVYYEFMQELRVGCIEELEFLVKKGHRSFCQRRTYFNTLYWNIVVINLAIKTGMFDREKTEREQNK